MYKTSFDKDLKKAVQIVKESGAKKIILFGSCIRDLNNARDIDFALGGVPKGVFFRLMGELIKELENPIDVVDLDLVDNYLKMRITEQGRILYESRN